MNELERNLRNQMGDSNFETAYKSAFVHLKNDRFGDFPTHEVTLRMVQELERVRRGGEPHFMPYGAPGVPTPEPATMRILEGRKTAGSSGSGTGSGGCYIATAVYGSYDAPEVLTLRRFRDEFLVKSVVGRGFVKTYYRFSPPIAKKLEHAKHINLFVRKLLDKLVQWLEG
jgi:hypothetical protein